MKKKSISGGYHRQWIVENWGVITFFHNQDICSSIGNVQLIILFLVQHSTKQICKKTNLRPLIIPDK